MDKVRFQELQYLTLRKEIEDSLSWRSHSWPASLLHRCYCGGDISPQIAHSAPYPIALDHIEVFLIGPLIEQIGEIDPGTHGNFYPHIEARIDLHQVGLSGTIPPKFDLGVAFQFDFPH